RHRASVFAGRFVVVRVGGGVGDDARHFDPVATELGGDAAPEVLRRDHPQLARGGARSRLGATAPGQEGGRREQRDEQAGEGAEARTRHRAAAYTILRLVLNYLLERPWEVPWQGRSPAGEAIVVSYVSEPGGRGHR